MTEDTGPTRDAIDGAAIAVSIITSLALAIGLLALHRIVLSTSAGALVTDNDRQRS